MLEFPLADLFLHSYEGEFVQNLHKKKNSLVVTFNLTFQYIEDELSIINNNFHWYVDSIHPSEL